MLARVTTALLLCAVLLSSCATTSTFAPQLPAPALESAAVVVSAPASIWAAETDRFLGAYVEDTGFEKQIGREFSIQLYYHKWGNAFGTVFEEAARKGRITMATWEFRQSLSGADDPYALKPLQSIVDGQHDAYLKDFARDAKAFDKPLFLRWGHEMNGNWYQWSGFQNNGARTGTFGDPQKPDGPELFVAAYRHIYDVFQQTGASNVLWVWCPNVVLPGPLSFEWNRPANYYPGDDYVDWLCMDGYNWGTSQFLSRWQTFDEVFRATYDQLRALNAAKPMMIGETASSELGGDKAAWIKDAFARLSQDYPQIRALVWFNIDKETNWRIDSSPASLKAFTEAVDDLRWATAWPGFQSMP